MSTVRRYDFSRPLSQAAKDYLSALVGDDLAALLVTWFDPMSQDDASRIVCQATRSKGMAESPANRLCELEIMVVTRWTQATMDADFREHDRRTNITFDKMMSATLADDLDAVIADGIGIDFVQPVRDFNSAIEGKEGGFIADTMTLGVHAFSTETPQPVA